MAELFATKQDLDQAYGQAHTQAEHYILEAVGAISRMQTAMAAAYGRDRGAFHGHAMRIVGEISKTLSDQFDRLVDETPRLSPFHDSWGPRDDE